MGTSGCRVLAQPTGALAMVEDLQTVTVIREIEARGSGVLGLRHF